MRVPAYGNTRMWYEPSPCFGPSFKLPVSQCYPIHTGCHSQYFIACGGAIGYITYNMLRIHDTVPASRLTLLVYSGTSRTLDQIAQLIYRQPPRELP